ncbi:MAG: VWA domain-containing protein, partial [Planctomycetes bacterium]|nr:VWA domain-containing protein [Planctomycetota bacterium]
ADGETNIHGALKAALGLHEKPSLEATLEDIPDTVYFLTDGSPTEGEITSTPELLGWFEDINRFGKVKLNVIAFGSLGVDLTFLRALAQVGGGDFIHVPEER